VQTKILVDKPNESGEKRIITKKIETSSTKESLKISEKKTVDQDKPVETENSRLNLEDIKSNWHKVITQIANIKTSVAMVLEQTLPINLNQKKLDVAVYDQPRFSFDRLERNRSLIENIFEEIFKQTIRITFIINNNHLQTTVIQENTDESNVQENSDPVMNRVLEIFDGEIIR